MALPWHEVSQAGNGSMTGTWQCPLTPALAGQPWAAPCRCPPFIQAGLAALVTGTMLLVLYGLKSGSRDQPAELVLNPVLRVAPPSLLPGDPLCHVAFPTQLALVLFRGTGGWGFAGVQQLLWSDP